MTGLGLPPSVSSAREDSSSVPSYAVRMNRPPGSEADCRSSIRASCSTADSFLLCSVSALSLPLAFFTFLSLDGFSDPRFPSVARFLLALDCFFFFFNFFSFPLERSSSDTPAGLTVFCFMMIAVVVVVVTAPLFASVMLLAPPRSSPSGGTRWSDACGGGGFVVLEGSEEGEGGRHVKRTSPTASCW